MDRAALAARALALAGQFKSHNLRDFVIRRTIDHLGRISAMPAAEQDKQLEKVAALLDVAERQLPIQNAYANEPSVLDDA